ncbi:DUF808 domain-containing protein [Thiomicrorhabdus cannonii]|uniref:DUF808 domain-containing protein n=1 Tax=Thiomicrorhabdus cannonii TaxID=2748011 RepID=UPI0015BBC109|nr:DUF808 domain-containing protein [Thiomicrorhabdus cannonii]
MASGLFVILDDIATLFDDVATMSKLAAKKTAGVLGDDLAVGAQRASDFHASRELPVIWAITKGSLLNKLIILPLAFLLSAFWPEAIVPILLIGGAYLSYEGAEKIYEFLFHRTEKSAPACPEIADNTDLLAIETKNSAISGETKNSALSREKQKIRSAILTDFILSVEIIIIALGAVSDQTIPVQIAAVTFVALLAVVGVYGLVALMVRMDDAGFRLVERSQQHTGLFKTTLRLTGQSLIAALPKLIRLLAVVGTLAMLLVGGGIAVHNLEAVHHAFDSWPSLLADLTVGLMIGTAVLLIVKLSAGLRRRF